MPPRKQQELLTAAVALEADAQRALISGDVGAARVAFAEAVPLYRQSWELAHATAYGRLVGMLKAGVLAGGGAPEAEYVRGQLRDARPAGPTTRKGSPSATASYALGLAALILGDDEEAQARAGSMSAGGEAFARTGDAMAALAALDQPRYAAALEAIVRDFEQRSEHLTGVAIADTALVLSELGARRGMAVAIESPVLPAF
ncbi:MAG TPA: hypothetical protein VME22_18440 [Solirubrobacteraceae bacterium]|nr:hypothetical protein [Solirubrobacteraceae bacterium]